MKYHVVQDCSLSDFLQTVNEYLKQGWEAQGGVAVTEVGVFTYYYQAIVKTEVEE